MARCRVIILLVLTGPAMVEAAIVVDHSANRTGWSISDASAGGGTWWEFAADDITLDAPSTIRHITWWGLFYEHVVPNMDSVRVRFYDSRFGDGLPGAVVFEQHLVDPSRKLTGEIVQQVPPGTSLTAAEYQFDSDLAIPIALAAHTTYWLEIAQDGVPATTFGWRGANADLTGRVVRNFTYNDWLYGNNLDMAFQLSTIPEPATLGLLVVALGMLKARALRRNGFISSRRPDSNEVSGPYAFAHRAFRSVPSSDAVALVTR